MKILYKSFWVKQSYVSVCVEILKVYEISYVKRQIVGEVAGRNMRTDSRVRQLVLYMSKYQTNWKHYITRQISKVVQL